MIIVKNEVTCPECGKPLSIRTVKVESKMIFLFLWCGKDTGHTYMSPVSIYNIIYHIWEINEESFDRNFTIYPLL